MGRRTGRRDRGAVAVEFALVIPLFFALLLGIIEFSNFYRVQISVSQAAREAARSFAISHNTDTASNAGKAAAPSLNTASLSFAFTGGTCDPKAVPVQTINAVATYPYATLTGFSIPSFGTISMPTSVNGTSSMRCGG